MECFLQLGKFIYPLLIFGMIIWTTVREFPKKISTGSLNYFISLTYIITPGTSQIKTLK